MPRLFRKISHQEGGRMNRSLISSASASQHTANTYMTKIEKYDNNTSTMGKGEKYTLVQYPLRTKVSTMSGRSGSHIGATKSSAVKPLQTMEELKRLQRERAS